MKSVLVTSFKEEEFQTKLNKVLAEYSHVSLVDVEFSVTHYEQGYAQYSALVILK